MSEKQETLPGRVFRQFASVDRRHRGAIEQKIRRFGIHRSQHMLLMYLGRQSTPPTQADIAKAFNISPASVAVTLQKLAAAGLIERVPRDGDSRANDILITRAGAEVIEQTVVLFDEVDTAMCAGITDEEMEQVMSILERMNANLSASGE